MAYILQSIDIEKVVVTIPSAIVQTLDPSNPYVLVDTNNQFIAAPIACFINIANNQTTPYTGFIHVHLTNTGNGTVGDLCATYSANASGTSDLVPTGLFGMVCNFQATPNRFGGILASKPLSIFFDVLPTAGDGDMIVTLYYVRIII
jgi:hypothetical protein